MNDNRNYEYSYNSVSKRKEYEIILNWIKAGSTVIDLGCGDGTLLSLLKDKNINGEGIDMSPSGVRVANKKGLIAREGRIDIHLPFFKNKQFDYSICNVTIQMVMYPEVLLSEMKRISKYQIISFPNFAFIVNRFELLFLGRMPKTMIPNYEWYSTGHIHQLAVNDFLSLAQKTKLNIVDSNFLFPKQLFFLPKKILNIFSTFFATEVIFLTN